MIPQYCMMAASACYFAAAVAYVWDKQYWAGTTVLLYGVTCWTLFLAARA